MGLEVFVVSTILLFIVATLNITFAFIDGAISLTDNNVSTGLFKGDLGKTKLDNMKIGG